MHGIKRVGQGTVVPLVLHLTAGHIMPRFVKHIHAHRPHVVVEHVGTLQVIVIFKRQIQPCRTVLRLVVHHVAGHRQGTGYQPAPHCKPFFNHIPHKTYLFVLHSHYSFTICRGSPLSGLASLCSIPLGAFPFHPAFKTHGVRTGCLSRRRPQPQRYRPLPFTKAFGERIVFKKRRMRPPNRPTCPPL